MHALGRHVLLELYDCDAEVLKDLEKVREEMVEAARRAQATIVTVTFHEFNPLGSVGVVISLLIFLFTPGRSIATPR
jgi:S-adenosylmethionine decarboxylase